MSKRKIPGSDSYFELNYRGMGELLKSVAIQQMLRERMAPVQAAVPGSELDVVVGRSRARAKVIHGSDFDEANTGDLSRALDNSGGSRGTNVVSNKPTRR